MPPANVERLFEERPFKPVFPEPTISVETIAGYPNANPDLFRGYAAIRPDDVATGVEVFDAPVRATIESFSAETLQTIVDDYSATKQGRFDNLLRSFSDFGKALISDTKTAAWAQELTAKRSVFGLGRNKHLASVLHSWTIRYGQAVPRSYLPREEVTLRPEQQAFLRINEQEVEYEAIHTLLKAQGYTPDFSLKTLNGHTYALLASANTALIALALDEVKMLGGMGPARQLVAKRLLDKHARTLFGNNTSAPKLLEDVAKEYNVLIKAFTASGVKSAQVLQVLRALRDRPNAIKVDFDNILEVIDLMYAAHGYESPLTVDETGIRWNPPQDKKVAEEYIEHSVDPKVVARDGLARVELRKAFEQLDEVLLPRAEAGESFSDAAFTKKLREIVEQTTENAGDMQIAWERLHDLVAISERFGGKLYVSKAAFATQQPYYITEFMYAGVCYAVAETPGLGRATYIVSEQACNASWVEVLLFPRREAQQLGAIPVVHANKNPHGPEHQQKIINIIKSLSLAAPLGAVSLGNSG